jgi:hypothetical protein
MEYARNETGFLFRIDFFVAKVGFILLAHGVPYSGSIGLV